MVKHKTQFMEHWNQHCYFIKIWIFLLKFGFKINPFGVCVSNKMSNGKQTTTVFNVGNIKASHRDHQKFILSLNGWNKNMKSKDWIHQKQREEKCMIFLGMTSDFSRQGKFTVDMKKYV